MLRCDVTIEKHRFLDRNECTMFLEIIKKKLVLTLLKLESTLMMVFLHNFQLENVDCKYDYNKNNNNKITWILIMAV